MIRKYPYSILLLCALLVFLQVGLMHRGKLSIYDDAFITFRYSKHLADGIGPVFNAGERVEGYTNFLWMAILSILYRIGLSLEASSILLGMLAALGLLYSTSLLAGKLGLDGWTRLIPALLIATTASVARYAISGMETLLFGVLLTWGSALLLSDQGSRSKTLIASLALLLATLTRPEGLLFAAFGLVYCAAPTDNLRDGRSILKILSDIAIFAFPWLIFYLPYTLWRLDFYGYLLPNTFYAKVGAGSLSASWRGVRYLLLMVPLVNPQLFLPLVALPWMRISNDRRFVSILIGLYLLYLVFIGGDDYRVFGPRLLIPIMPMLSILGVAAVHDLLDRFALRWKRTSALGLFIGLGLLFLVYGRIERNAYTNLMTTMNLGWANAAEWLSQEAPETAVIAVDAAGIIPFYTGLEAIDMHGLNDGHIAHVRLENMGAGLAGHEKTDPQYVINRRPDYVTVWIDEEGRPAAAGLDRVARRFLQNYYLSAIVLMQPLEPEARPVLPGETLDEDLHLRGYIYGIFAQK